ncbi:MAG TPA: hypothetical protein VIK65_11540 [Candidatus Limnocylindrales bacterium]|jgi:hypothetical protein
MSRRPRKPADEDASIDDLKATSESIRTDVHELERIEDEKLNRRPGDGDLRRLSSEAVELAERIEKEAKAERQIAREVD